jgi:hypothetical protein
LLKLKGKLGSSDFIPLCGDYLQLKLKEESELNIYGYPNSKMSSIKKANGIVKTAQQYGSTANHRLLKVHEKNGRAKIIHQISAE